MYVELSPRALAFLRQVCYYFSDRPIEARIPVYLFMDGKTSAVGCIKSGRPEVDSQNSIEDVFSVVCDTDSGMDTSGPRSNVRIHGTSVTLYAYRRLYWLRHGRDRDELD